MFDRLLKRLTEANDRKNLKDEKYKFFVNRTKKHIALVKRACEKIVDAYPEFKELIQRAKVHDASKFEEPELTPYIEIIWKKAHGDKSQTEEERKATLHHIMTNSHHPEFHVLDKSQVNLSAEDRDKSEHVVDASAMPDLDIAEMVADWQAMSEELGTNTAREWFNKQKDVRWHFSDEQVELIDKLLKVFEEPKPRKGR